jgi:hypothetical protein
MLRERGGGRWGGVSFGPVHFGEGLGEWVRGVETRWGMRCDKRKAHVKLTQSYGTNDPDYTT